MPMTTDQIKLVVQETLMMLGQHSPEHFRLTFVCRDLRVEPHETKGEGFVFSNDDPNALLEFTNAFVDSINEEGVSEIHIIEEPTEQ